MKKLIILIFVVLVIAAIIKIFGIGFSISQEEYKNTEEGSSETVAMMLSKSTYEEIIGYSLPNTASNVHYKKWTSYHANSRGHNSVVDAICWVVATLSQDDFYQWIEENDIQKTSNLLKSNPNILNCESKFFRKFWDLDGRNVEHIYYHESEKYEEYIVCTHDNNKIYIKKVITYTEDLDEDQNLFYEKVRESADS